MIATVFGEDEPEIIGPAAAEANARLIAAAPDLFELATAIVESYPPGSYASKEWGGDGISRTHIKTEHYRALQEVVARVKGTA